MSENPGFTLRGILVSSFGHLLLLILSLPTCEDQHDNMCIAGLMGGVHVLSQVHADQYVLASFPTTRQCRLMLIVWILGQNRAGSDSRLCHFLVS